MTKNKRAQASEGLTWIVSTLVIIAVLLAFLYISISLGKAKAISPNKLSIKTESSSGNVEWADIKTLMAYSKNVTNKNEIDLWTNERDIYPEETKNGN